MGVVFEGVVFSGPMWPHRVLACMSAENILKSSSHIHMGRGNSMMSTAMALPTFLHLCYILLRCVYSVRTFHVNSLVNHIYKPKSELSEATQLTVVK